MEYYSIFIQNYKSVRSLQEFNSLINNYNIIFKICVLITLKLLILAFGISYSDPILIK